jgi:hypothetical protein
MKNILITIIILLSLITTYLIYTSYIKNREEKFTSYRTVYISDNIDNLNDRDDRDIISNTSGADRASQASTTSGASGASGEKQATFAISSDVMVKSIDYMKRNNKISRYILGVSTDDYKFLIDPYINKYILNNKLSNTEVFKDGIFVCLSPTRFGIEECIWDFTNKVVAYVYMSDYLFIQALIKAYRQDITRIRLRKIKLEDLKSSDKQFDYLITYVVIGSEYMALLKYSRYFISGLKDMDISRIKAFYPVIRANYESVRFYFNKDTEDTTYDLYLSKDKMLLPIMNYDIVNNIENFITRLEMPKDYLEAIDESYEGNTEFGGGSSGSYGCYGNNKIVNKFECDSYYTKEGNPKDYYSIWDKKCATNEECPYYKKNTRYENSRGGCINGNCELPIGVKKIGFTKYNDEEYNRPLCYNCQDTTDLNCCANIKEFQDINANGNANGNTNANDVGINNDYVFENDTEDRKNNNLNTIISLLDYRSI